MSVNYATAVKTARVTATRDYFANGTLEIQAAGGAVLAAFGLSATGGTISGDTWTLVLDAATVVATGGAPTDATQAVIKNEAGVVGISGLTVGVATGVPETEPDVTLDNVSINTGQNVTLSSLTIQHAA